MEIRPILSALMRSKVSMILIGLQVALTLAIVCNALFIIVERAQLMNRPSGMNESDTFTLRQQRLRARLRCRTRRCRPISHCCADCRAWSMRRRPTPRRSANGGWGTGVMLRRKQKTPTAESALYFVDSHGINTFDTHLIAGRNFKPEEIAQHGPERAHRPPVIIVTKALADKLFPDGDAIGKSVYLDEDPPSSTIVGVVDRLQEPWVNNKDIENVVADSGLHAVRQLLALPRAHRTRPPRRSDEGRRTETRARRTPDASSARCARWKRSVTRPTRTIAR